MYGRRHTREVQFSSTIHAPIEQVDLPTWRFGLSESEYQSCSPAHVSAGITTAPDGRRMSINVEVLGGSPMVQHYVDEIAKRTICDWYRTQTSLRPQAMYLRHSGSELTVPSWLGWLRVNNNVEP
jgi:hypothetical protein